MRVIVAAGGTAGHIYPGLSLAEVLRAQGADVTFLGRAGGQEARLVPEAGFDLRTVEARPFARKLSPAAVRAPLTALRAAHRCRSLIRDTDVVAAMGGYVAVPAVLAAWRERVPLVLHEQNAVPGLANRVAARWARLVCLSFAEAGGRLPPSAPKAVTGNPVRPAILRVREERGSLADEGHRELKLEPDRRTVVVFGGSQGALHVAQAAAGAARRLVNRGDLQMVVITGPAHYEDVSRRLPSSGALLVRARPYVDRMETVYAAADLVIARAGASTIAELSVCGIPALLVPYPYATGRHQEANARALQRAGGAGVMLDDQVNPASLAERTTELIDHPQRLAAMAERSTSFGRPDAAEALARRVLDVAERRRAA